MGGKGKKKGIDVVKNRRLDLFLEKLQIEQDKKKQILDYVEKLTFDTLKKNSLPQLRLKK